MSYQKHALIFHEEKETFIDYLICISNEPEYEVWVVIYGPRRTAFKRRVYLNRSSLCG